MRQRGMTLLELMVFLSLLTSISVVCGGVALHAARSRDVAAACAQDVEEARRVLDEVERDLRGAKDVRVTADELVLRGAAGETRWRREGASLVRDDVVRARNVASFRASREDMCVAVELVLGRRSPDARSSARVATLVHPRAWPEVSR
jgi:type II secretory pathway component PulJ